MRAWSGSMSSEEVQVWYPRATTFLEEELCTAAAENNLSRMRRILQERVDLNWLNGFGFSPLHIASEKGNFEVMKMLICNKALVDIENAAGVTPLHLAAKGDHFRCAQLLVLAGAYAAKKCWSLCTPREFAPNGSETQLLLESCEQGFIPDPREVFEMTMAPLVPKWSIPPKPDEKALKKAKEEAEKKKKK